jgi:hypothetical protein
LPLEGELWSIIERQYDWRPPGCAWVFYRPNARRVITFRKNWERACREADAELQQRDDNGLAGRLPLTQMLFHDLRRTASRNFRRAGLSESDSMAITGHKTAAIFKRYSIVSEGDLRDAVWRAQAFAAEQMRAAVTERNRGKSVANKQGEAADEHLEAIAKSREVK